MAATEGAIKKADLAKAREIDYVWRFANDIRGLMTLLGVTRPIPVVSGTLLKAYKTTGELLDGSQVAEGDTIPLSNFKTEVAFTKEAKLNKYRKAATAEAILKGGFDQAVLDTDKKALSEAHKAIKADLLAAFTPESGATPVTGVGLQKTLANASAELAIKFDDTDYEPVHLVNPRDLATYLGNAQISMQSRYGVKYLEDFLGLGTLIALPGITQGTTVTTAKENIQSYFVVVNEANGLGEVFDFTTDETGLVGMHTYADYDNMTAATTFIDGVNFFPELVDGIIAGTIEPEV
jgi:hypothetical protein